MAQIIYCTRKIPENGIQSLREKGYVVDIGENEVAPTKEELQQALSVKPYTGLISFLTDSLDGEIFDVCPTLKIIAQYSVGYDNIDIKEAHTRGIAIANTKGTSSLAVAEHAVALMLALTTRLAEGDRYMRDGKYVGWSPYLFNGTDLSKKTIGILGGGAIGFEVAKILHFGFNCLIVYSDIKPNESFEKVCNATFLDKETLLEKSDIVSLHVPLLPSTKHLIDKAALAKMKSSSFLINTARGSVIDEVALIEALREKKIAGAGLDVYEFEPHVSEGLVSLSNVVLTPHIASSRDTARRDMADMVAQNIITFFESGKPLQEIL